MRDVPTMVCRSTHQSVLDEAAFPVRVRVLVPARGFGQTLDAMHRWLNRGIGRSDHAVHSAAAFTDPALAFHFRDVEAARRFLEAFPSLVLADGTTGASYTSPALPFGRRT